MGSPAEGYQTAAFPDAHNTHTAGIPALGGDLCHRDTDNDAVVADEDHIVLFPDCQNARYRPVLLGIIVLDALASTALQTVFCRVCTASLSVFGYSQDGGVLHHRHHAHHNIVLFQIQRTHAPGSTAQNTGIGFIEADGHTLTGCHNELILTAGEPYPGQTVALVQGNGDQAHLAHIAVSRQLSTLDHALFGDHAYKLALVLGTHPDHGSDLLALLQLEEVDNIGTNTGTAALADLIALEPVDTAPVGEEQDIVMGGAEEQFFHEVLVPLAHARNTPSAPALGLVGISRLTLDIPQMGQGDDTVAFGDQILDVHFTAHSLYLGTAGISVLLTDSVHLTLDNGLELLLIAENALQLGNLAQDLSQFFLDLDAFHTGQLAQTHGYNGAGLLIGDTEPLAEVLLGIGLILRVADNMDHFVGVIHNQLHTLENVFPFLGLAQVELGTPGDDLLLEVDVMGEDLPQGHDLGLTVMESQHDNAHCILELGIVIQLVEHHLGIGVPL